MAKQTINIGTSPNSKTGDTIRDAFTKTNSNFNELYAHLVADVQIPSQTNNAGKVLKTTGSSLLFENITYAEITGKPTLFSGSYNDLTNKPMIFSGSYDDLTNKPSVITVSQLKTIVAQSTDFNDFKTRIAAL